MKKYLTTILLALTLFIGEIHTFWANVDRKENWIITKYEPMTVQWNVKFLCDEINVILYFIAAYFLAKYPNRINRTSVFVFVQIAIIDLCLYFWDFKTQDYHLVYFCIAITFLITFWKDIKQRLIR